MKRVLEFLAFLVVVALIAVLVVAVAGNPFYYPPSNDGADHTAETVKQPRDCFPKDYEARLTAINADSTLSPQAGARRRLELVAERTRAAVRNCPDLFSPVFRNRLEEKER